MMPVTQTSQRKCFVFLSDLAHSMISPKTFTKNLINEISPNQYIYTSRVILIIQYALITNI